MTIRDTFKVHTYAAAKLQRAKPEPPPVFPVETLRPHPKLWEAAVKSAGGDVSRVEIVTPTEIRVNPPRRGAA